MLTKELARGDFEGFDSLGDAENCFFARCELWEANFEPLLAVVKIYTVHLVCGRL